MHIWLIFSLKNLNISVITFIVSHVEIEKHMLYITWNMSVRTYLTVMHSIIEFLIITKRISYWSPTCKPAIPITSPNLFHRCYKTLHNGQTGRPQNRRHAWKAVVRDSHSGDNAVSRRGADCGPLAVRARVSHGRFRRSNYSPEVNALCVRARRHVCRTAAPVPSAPPPASSPIVGRPKSRVCDE